MDLYREHLRKGVKDNYPDTAAACADFMARIEAAKYRPPNPPHRSDGPRNRARDRAARNGQDRDAADYQRSGMVEVLRLKYAVGDRQWDATKPCDLPPRTMTTFFEAGGSMGGNEPPPKDRPRSAAEYVPDVDYPGGTSRMGRQAPARHVHTPLGLAPYALRHRGSGRALA